METALDGIAKRAGKAVNNWWLLLITSILLFAMGIIVFCSPIESYIGLSIFFGIAILCYGVSKLALAIASQNYFMTRSYAVIGGIIDTLLGIFLCLYPGITLTILSIILGCWILYDSFLLMGLGSDLSVFHVKGWSWSIFAGLILLVLAFAILVKPFAIGIQVVVLLTGIAFVVAGITSGIVAFRLRNIHIFFKKKKKNS